jgi:subtilisin family serine protease
MIGAGLTSVQSAFYYTPGNDLCSIGTYAVNDSIISAGAFAARNSYYSYFQNNIVTDRTQTVGDITSFSSYQAAGYGPTGVALPTICAPGFDVVAAGSRYSYFANNNVATVMKTDDGSYWGVMTGTSMAAPTVAGIIALWLQANPTLCVRQVKEIIAETAIHDSFTTGANAAHFGPNGKIDAMAGMRSVLDRMGFLLGDVDHDGDVGIKDLTALIDYLLGDSVSSIQLLNADVDCDGNVDIADATILIDALVTGREIAY